MSYLKQVIYSLPSVDQNFTNDFLSFLGKIGKTNGDQVSLSLSESDFFPETIFQFKDIKIPSVLFLGNDFEHSVEIKNSAGKEKQSPHSYSHINISDFIQRLSNFKLEGVDHTGFNLPYFEGVHPEILKLRQLLKDKCLYHEFPKALADEPWDFILPGSIKEISGEEIIDYHKNRKPKIEIVSFSKSSTPLIQIDIQLNAKYEDLIKLFPEAINDSDLKIFGFT